MTFKALLAAKTGETVSTRVVEMSEQDLMPGDVTIAVDYSTVNYKDALAVPGSVRAGKVCGSPFLTMDGGAVFKFAVKVLGDMVDEVLSAHRLDRSAIDWLIPHQANIRIIQATARKLGLPMEKVVVTVDRHANTSAASIPLALDAAVRDGRIRAGQLVLMEGVGGGFTWGSALVRI